MSLHAIGFPECLQSFWICSRSLIYRASTEKNDVITMTWMTTSFHVHVLVTWVYNRIRVILTLPNKFLLETRQNGGWRVSWIMHSRHADAKYSVHIRATWNAHLIHVHLHIVKKPMLMSHEQAKLYNDATDASFSRVLVGWAENHWNLMFEINCSFH